MSVMAEFPFNTVYETGWKMVPETLAGRWMGRVPLCFPLCCGTWLWEKVSACVNYSWALSGLPLSQQAQDKGMNSLFFPLSRAIHWPLTSQPSLLGLWVMASSRPSNQGQRGRLSSCCNSQELGLCSSMKCKWTHVRIRVRTWTEKPLNAPGLSPLTQGTVGQEREESPIRGGLRHDLLKSHLTTCKWYYLSNWLENKHVPQKQQPNNYNHHHNSEQVRGIIQGEPFSSDTGRPRTRMINEAVRCSRTSHCALWIKFTPSMTHMCPLLCVNSKDLAFKGLSLRLCSQASTLSGIKLSCEINPRAKNSIWIYPN